MNFQRYTGKTSRDAMLKVRQALGPDAVVLSTKPCAEGVEILAMAPAAIAAMEREAEQATRPQAALQAPKQQAVQQAVPTATRSPNCR